MSAGTKSDPWRLQTPPGTSEYEMYRDERDGTAVIVCALGLAELEHNPRNNRMRAI